MQVLTKTNHEQRGEIPPVAMYESQVISKSIKTNYFAPPKIYIHYKTIKIYNNNKSSKVIKNHHNFQT